MVKQGCAGVTYNWLLSGDAVHDGQLPPPRYYQRDTVLSPIDGRFSVPRRVQNRRPCNPRPQADIIDECQSFSHVAGRRTLVPAR